ncbi:hypothetical protein ABZ379_31610 [Streptomyces canus]|uniref:hypothetical protein n=1 Tax=Streptomyces canus TaxID=58343 RepID=UPI0033C86CEB
MPDDGKAARSIFEKESEAHVSTVLIAAAGQYFAGTLAIRTIASFVPVFGSGVNATVSFGTVEAVGWGLYLLLEEDKDFSRLTKEDVLDAFRRGESHRDEMKKSGRVDWIDRLPKEVKKKIEALSKEMGAPETSDERRIAILKEMEELTDPYREK